MEEIEKEFQNLIKEKASRIRTLAQQEEENDRILAELDGQIKAEKKQGELCAVRKEYIRENAKMDGLSEGEKISEFFNSLHDGMSMEQRMEIWRSLENKDLKKFNDEQHTKRVDLISGKVDKVVYTKDELEHEKANPVITADGSTPMQVHVAK